MQMLNLSTIKRYECAFHDVVKPFQLTACPVRHSDGVEFDTKMRCGNKVKRSIR